LILLFVSVFPHLVLALTATTVTFSEIALTRLLSTADNKCAEGFVCYRRKPNENIPDCCSGDKSKGTNYCVSAGCAAYTDTSRTEDDPPHWVLFDDDHLIKELETTLKQCQGNCKSDNDVRLLYCTVLYFIVCVAFVLASRRAHIITFRTHTNHSALETLFATKI